MTYPLDDATGLPVLPEGLFYRVNETSVEIRTPLPDVERPYYYTPLHPYEQYDTREVQVARSYRPWYLFGGYSNRKITELQTWITGRSRAVSLAYTEESGESECIRGVDIPKRVPITKSDVLPLAIKALDRYNEEQERKALLGDYPPKKLENDND